MEREGSQTKSCSSRRGKGLNARMGCSLKERKRETERTREIRAGMNHKETREWKRKGKERES